MEVKNAVKSLFYPAVGFHFMVSLGGFPKSLYDIQFQSVSGLKAQIGTDTIIEGGGNGFEHKVPLRRTYSDLVLKRGVLVHHKSELLDWCKEAFSENATGRGVEPKNLQVVLLNSAHLPIMIWDVIHAWPKSWEYSDLNAENNEILIETITLNYNRSTVKKLAKIL